MPQSRPTANPRYQEEEKKEIFFLLLFSAYKNVKSFYTGKIAKKNAFCLWHVRPFILLFMAYAEPVYSSFRTPTLPYRAQPLLNATGKMFLNWGLDCSSICSRHAPVVNCLPNKIIRKSIQVIMSYLENLILVFGVMTSHFTSSVQLRALLIS